MWLLKCYKDSLKTNPRSCGISTSSFEEDAKDWSLWRQICSSGMSTFEVDRAAITMNRRENRKQGLVSLDSPYGMYQKLCDFHICLHSHEDPLPATNLHLPVHLLCQQESPSLVLCVWLLLVGLTIWDWGLSTCGLVAACPTCILVVCDIDSSDLAYLPHSNSIGGWKPLPSGLFLYSIKTNLNFYLIHWLWTIHL